MNELESEVKKLIISRYGTVKNFADMINLPYSTVDTILKRGFKNSKAYNVGVIFGALQLDTSSLLDGKIKPLKIELSMDDFEDFEGFSEADIDEILHSSKVSDYTAKILEFFKKMDRKEQYEMIKFFDYLSEHSHDTDGYFNTSDQDE